LINDNDEGDEYVSHNDDTNYKFTIRTFTGTVCFGYIEKNLPVDEENTISMCFNNETTTRTLQTHHTGATPYCDGNFTHATDTAFNVTVLLNNVSIISLHRTF
jgi:hypothetical protein